jgi:hypothetical protein
MGTTVTQPLQARAAHAVTIPAGTDATVLRSDMNRYTYAIEDLLVRAESLQLDALRHLDDEPHLEQVQGLTDILLDLGRSSAALRRKLKAMRTGPAASLPARVGGG